MTKEGGGPFPGSHRAELHLHRRSSAVAGCGGVIYHITVFCEEPGAMGTLKTSQLESDHRSQASVYLILFLFQDRTLCSVEHKHT